MAGDVLLLMDERVGRAGKNDHRSWRFAAKLQACGRWFSLENKGLAAKKAALGRLFEQPAEGCCCFRAAQ
jgi:hypothetical protein